MAKTLMVTSSEDPLNKVGEDELVVNVSTDGDAVFIDFIDEHNQYCLTHSYENIEMTSVQGDKMITCMNGLAKTEFRPPLRYTAPKDKARLFWDDLVNNGWSVE